jgi:uncharacterized protein YwqG
MGTELVLLSDVDPTVPERRWRAIAAVAPDASEVELRGGDLAHVVAADGLPLLTIHRPRPVLDARAARAAVADPPTSFALWTEISVPYGAPDTGHEIARILAGQVGGVLRDLGGHRPTDPAPPPLALPAVLEDKRALIEATLRPAVRLELTPDTAAHRGTSRLGGLPWWPVDQPWPLDRLGQPLGFLAQLNFAELPAPEPFPTHGLLQFFVGADDTYGAGFTYARPELDSFAVVFRPALDPSVPLITATPAPGAEPYCPVDRPALIVGTRVQQPVTWYDHRFEELLGVQTDDGWPQEPWGLSEEQADAYADASPGPGKAHLLGGYPTFFNLDPREIDGLDEYELLLQFDSQAPFIDWGGGGVGHFFIPVDDLIRHDFSRVRYSWDT